MPKIKSQEKSWLFLNGLSEGIPYTKSLDLPVESVEMLKGDQIHEQMFLASILLTLA